MTTPITPILRPRVVTRKPRQLTEAEHLAMLKTRFNHETQRSKKS
jgi:hypothetical protein